jgi:hypothetical protein
MSNFTTKWLNEGVGSDNYAAGSPEMNKKFKKNPIGSKDKDGNVVTHSSYDKEQKKYLHFTSKGPANLGEDLDEVFPGSANFRAQLKPVVSNFSKKKVEKKPEETSGKKAC